MTLAANAVESLVAGLMTFDTKTEAQVMDETVVLEVTNLTSDGRVEVAYTDRTERVYLRFSLPELIALACKTQLKD